MRVLQIHCSSFTYTVTRRTPAAELPQPQTAELKDVLVCFICFEKRDEGRESELVKRYVTNLCIDVSRINCGRVLLHPYAHLSNKLGSPHKAKTS